VNVHFDEWWFEMGSVVRANGYSLSEMDGGADHDSFIAGLFFVSGYRSNLVIKLCNNNGATPKRGEPDYNPAYKYDMLSTMF
jgi:hypothetical protein